MYVGCGHISKIGQIKAHKKNTIACPPPPPYPMAQHSKLAASVNQINTRI